MKYLVLIALSFCLLLSCKNEVNQPAETEKKIEVPAVKYVKIDRNLMSTAISKSKETLPSFWKMYETNPNKAYVRFAFEHNNKKSELWSQIIEKENDDLKVKLMTLPEGLESYDELVSITTADITDWQIEQKVGEYKGGYTAQALILLKQSEESGSVREEDLKVPGFVDPLIEL